MKKKTKEKSGSIKSRWIKQILVVTTVALFLIMCILLYSVSARYYNAAEVTIRARVSKTIDTFFTYYNNGDEDLFFKGASDYIESFQYKDIMEVWVLDKKGNPIISSSGFRIPEGGEYTDYNLALNSESNTAVAQLKTSTGEPITALSYVLRDEKGEQYGAVRYLISMEEMFVQLTYLWLIIILCFILILTMITLSGQYFVSSIVNPVVTICKTTGEIAKGNFNVRIKNDYYNDEIGDLCNSINYMASQLSEIDKMKNEFISTVSHEIRTPLTAIMGWGETLKRAENNPELTDKGIDIILEETTRLSSMVEELLDFSRIQNDSIKLIITEIEILNVINQVSDIYKKKAEERDINLTVTSAVDEVFVFGDADKIRQVFINILDNAIKYTPQGGEVKIIVERNQKYVKIVFSDNGCGISADDIAHVKEKFYKANNTVRGTGIGLAVADEIVKKHGGEINIKSTYSEGTDVEIILPLGTKGDLNE